MNGEVLSEGVPAVLPPVVAEPAGRRRRKNPLVVRGVRRLWNMYRIKADPIGYCRSIGVQVGEGCWLTWLTEATFGSEPYLVSLGDHVCVASGVRFVTHDGALWVFLQENPGIDAFAPIKVGDNVFIGMNAVIMPGVTIGDDCIVAAGAVVVRDVPPGSIVGGVPGKVLGTVEDYWGKVAPTVVKMRHLDPEQRRDFLERTYLS